MSNNAEHDMGKQKCAERLDVEGDDERQSRIQIMLEKMNASSICNSPPPPHPALHLGPQNAFDPQGPSELLARVQAFIPQLAASNVELASRARENPDSVDIERLRGDEEQYIKMNLGLGVFESRRRPQSNAQSASSDGEVASTSESESESSSSSSSSPSSSDDSSDSTDSDSDSDSGASDESDDIISAIVRAARPIKPLPRRAREQVHSDSQGIVELGGSESTGDT